MANRQKLTSKRKISFLMALRDTCNVTRACERLSISRQCAYDHRNEDPEFREAWDNAINEGIDLLEDEARRRAFEGVEEPVFHQGKQVATVTKYSDTLTIFLLKAHRPERYRERYDHSVRANMSITVATGIESPPGGE